MNLMEVFQNPVSVVFYPTRNHFLQLTKADERQAYFWFGLLVLIILLIFCLPKFIGFVKAERLHKICTLPIQAMVHEIKCIHIYDDFTRRFDQVKSVNQYNHSFKSDTFPGVIFYNKYASYFGQLASCQEYTIYVNPQNVEEFYCPLEEQFSGFRLIVDMILAFLILLFLIALLLHF